MKLISVQSNGDRLIIAERLENGLLKIKYKEITKKAKAFSIVGTHSPTLSREAFALKAAAEWLEEVQV